MLRKELPSVLVSFCVVGEVLHRRIGGPMNEPAVLLAGRGE